jgi:HEAT repeat protein
MRTITRNRITSPWVPALSLALLVSLSIPALAGQAGAPARTESERTRALPGQEAAPAPSVAALESVLKDLALYDGGLNSDAFWKMRSIVLAAKDDPSARKDVEAKLLGFLVMDGTLVAKDSVCRMLRIIGGDASVPALRKMLDAADTTDMARYALEKIPGAAAEAALLDALDKTGGAVKLGVISSLADRKSDKAVAALGKLVAAPNPDLASAAVFALGRIGGKDAADVLGKTMGAAGAPPLKSAVASALIVCADEFLTQKDVPAAAAIYDRILSEKLAVSIRAAAMRGKILAAGDKAPPLILATLAAPDPDMQLPAIGLVKTFFTEANIGPVCDTLPKLPAASQVALTAVLSEYRGVSITAALANAARSDRKEVRLAALKAFEKAGDASSVALIAGIAAAAPPDEQAAARGALWGMKGKPVDEAILALLGGSPSDAVQAELIQSIGERRIFSGKTAAAKLAGSPSGMVRREAVKALKAIGTPSDIPGLLDVLLTTADESEQTGIETAIAGLALKIGQPEGRAKSVTARLAGEKDAPNRAILCRLLGRIGDDSSLPLIRQALADRDAAVANAAARALADWPTLSAKDDIILIARTSKNPTLQVLALRGYVRLTAKDKFRRPEEAVKDLKLALDLSARPEEKKLVLGALPDFAGPEALKLAESQLSVPGVQEEAKAAVKKIQDRMAARR